MDYNLAQSEVLHDIDGMSIEEKLIEHGNSIFSCSSLNSEVVSSLKSNVRFYNIGDIKTTEIHREDLSLIHL